MLQLIGMEDDFLSLMDDTGETREDLKVPEDSVGDEIRKAIEDEVDILVSRSLPFLPICLGDDSFKDY